MTPNKRGKEVVKKEAFSFGAKIVYFSIETVARASKYLL